MEQNQKEVLLKVEHLEQFFKMGNRSLKAVNDVSFEIYKGEVFGLVGESGCGKTTTGRSIIRLYDITGGSVYYKGKRICAGTRQYKEAIRKAKEEYKQTIQSIGNSKVRVRKEAIKNSEYNIDGKHATKKSSLFSDMTVAEFKRGEAKAKLDAIIAENEAKIKSAITDHKKYDRRKVGKKDSEQIMNEIQMIFQDPIASLDPRMTVRDIIAEGLIIRGIKDKAYIDEQVFKILETVGLVPEHATRYPHEFSGGQRQRIGIARAVVMNPELIIADEPISALDVSIQAQVINLLHELSEKMGLTILFIAHDLAVVKYFSDRIAVMYFGKIVELATSEELFKHPLHPYTKSLLSAIPVPDPVTEKNRKRITYNPILDHNYSTEGPTMREVTPGHYVYCNTEEFDKYVKECKE